MREVVAAAEAVTGRTLPVEIGPRRPGDPGHLVADASRAKEVLGWQPERSDLETIIADAWRWQQRLAREHLDEQREASSRDP